MLGGHPSRRLLISALTLGAITLVSAGQASAGYGVAPANGQTFPVTIDSRNSIESPRTIDLVVYLDAQDTDPQVWVSESPVIDSFGTPAGGSVGGCSVSTLIPFGEQNKWVCRVPTLLLEAGKTYYWWLDFKRQDPGATVATDRISGPFSFTLSDAEPPQEPEEPVVEPHTGVSTKTVGSAATLPGSSRYNGRRSIKHTVLDGDLHNGSGFRGRAWPDLRRATRASRVVDDGTGRRCRQGVDTTERCLGAPPRGR